MDNETIGDRLILMIQREWEAIENGNEPKSEIMDQAFEIARSLGVTNELAIGPCRSGTVHFENGHGQPQPGSDAVATGLFSNR